MDITKIDKNFKKQDVTAFKSNIYKMPNEKFNIFGGYYDNEFGFIKMPDKLSKEISEGVDWGSKCSAGIRLLFSTNSNVIKLKGEIFAKCNMYHMAFVGSACFSLCEIVKGKEIFVGNLCPNMDGEATFSAELKLQGRKSRDYILYFPLYSGVKALEIELAKNSDVMPYNYYLDKKPILYYGSSITQGGCASKPNNCYQSYVSEWSKLDYYILGFSGNARAEDKMIEFLRDFDCSIFVCDYDHNAPNAEHLRNTHLKLYKEFRSGKNKNTPIIFLSKPDARRDKEGKERYAIIKATYDYAIKNGDKNVYIINGFNIYPSGIREHCAVDGCHPTDLGFYFFAKKIYDIIKRI